jgi:hypothetical protein
MFTTGIFTTQIPYLAFVCMYVILFLSSHGKIPDNITAAEHGVIQIKPASLILFNIDQIKNEQNSSQYIVHPRLDSCLSIHAPKEKIAVFSSISFLEQLADYHMFSRPPPVCSATIS